MSRDLSIAAYHSIKEQGLLSERRMVIYEILFTYGPLTATEIAVRLTGAHSPGSGPNVHARLNELCALGVVQEVSRKVCQYTEQTVTIFDVTAKLPHGKKDKPVTSSQIISEFCDLAQRAVHGLEQTNASAKLWGRWLFDAKELIEIGRERTKSRRKTVAYDQE